MGRRRSKKRLQDAYGKRARREGFPARSVYKLEEIDRRLRLLRPGQNVLDLGAAPGSWTLYAAKKVGAKGRVLSIDLKDHEGPMPPNVDFRVGDAREQSVEDRGGPFDVVLSDMAPKTTGQRSLDQYRSFELYMTALHIAERTLKPGGAFVGKLFQGAEFEEAREAVRAAFAKAKVVRPKATRDESYEIFLCGLERQGEEPASEETPPEGDEEGSG